MKLTQERVNGIKSGYWSTAKKDELVQKLGPIEQITESLAGKMCDHYCRYPEERIESNLQEICSQCPMTVLMKLME